MAFVTLVCGAATIERSFDEGAMDRRYAALLPITDDAGDMNVIVLPVTRTPSHDTALAMEIPAPTKRGVRLDDERSWIVLAKA